MVLSIEALATLSLAFSCFALWATIGILALALSSGRRLR
jgi:hypothetical protein